MHNHNAGKRWDRPAGQVQSPQRLNLAALRADFATAKSGLIRTFIALETTEAISSALVVIIAELSRSGADVKWSDPHQAHLTLKFLGEIDPDRVAGIAAQMEQAASRHQAPVLTLTPIGAFPNLRHPRVIWIGLEGEVEPLQRLQHDLEERLHADGIPLEERSFQPHLTLGRVRTPSRLHDLIHRLQHDPPAVPPIRWTAGRIVLFQSTLTPTGPVYRPLRAAALAPKFGSSRPPP